MNPRSACTTTLVGLMACTALPSLADDITTFSVRVVDATGHAIGPYADNAVFVTIDGRKTAIFLGPLQANPAYLDYNPQVYLFFSEPDCTGTLYILAGNGVQGALPSAVQHRADGDYLYIADSRAYRSDLKAQSAYTNTKGAPSCQAQQNQLQGYPATTAPVNLAQHFQLPFTLK
ncbi:MAG TPA: hypothetical protein VH328_04100 [Burkholderiaceae bacterium]|nr:hypothetical protein [Burkholderiaceae bacterium]